MRVLVVEDQALPAFVLCEALERTGHCVVGPAKTSSQAVQLTRAHAPEIALVDLDLERKGAGVELADLLTAQFGIDVIICTGQPEIARRAQTGALGLIGKPYDPKDVVASLAVIESLRSGNDAVPFPSSFEPLISPQ